ncbi:MAG: FRG domain-containing protein [Solirubrobacteraceae bacterium]|jgi:hypothetical protein
MNPKPHTTTETIARPPTDPGLRHASSFGAAGIMGCTETEPVLPNWTDFVSEFAVDTSPSWLFRGQANCAWGLESSLQRALALANVQDPVMKAHSENSAIGFFKDRARRHLLATPAESDLLGWLALMQHYGAPTRLQDWTSSPFIAAYFAYREDLEADAAIWGIQAYLCRRAVTPDEATGLPWDHVGQFDSDPSVSATHPEHENAILRKAIRGRCRWPLPTLPFTVDSRMAAQQAAFLVITSLEFRVDALLDKSRWPDRPEGGWGEDLLRRAGKRSAREPYQLIKKIRLPRHWRDSVLHTLARMGITEDTMFPGLDGVGRATANQIAAGELALRDVLNST